MSETTLLTLEIGGGSDEAVSAVNATAEALANLQGAQESVNASSADMQSATATADDSFNDVTEASQQASGGLASAASSAANMGQQALGLSSSLGPLRESLHGAKEGAAELAQGGSLMGAGVTAGIAAVVALGAAGAQTGNQIIRLTAITGMDQAQVETWTHVYGMAGGNADSLSRSVLMIGKDMSAAAAGNEKYSSTFAALGVSMVDADGNAREAGDVFNDVMRSLANTDPVERQTLAVSLFGARFAGQVLPVLQNYNSIMPAAQALTESTAGSMEHAAQRALEYNKQTEILKTQVEALGVEALPLLSASLAAVAAVLGVVLPLAHDVASVFGVGAEVVGNMASVFTSLTSPMNGATMGFADQEAAVRKLRAEHNGLADDLANKLEAGMTQATSSGDGETASLLGTDAAAKTLSLSSLTLAQQIDRIASSAQSSMMTLDPLGAKMWADAQAADALAASVSNANAAMSAGGAGGSGGSYNVPGQQLGGPVSAGHLYRVNEQAGNTEFFRPNTGGQIIPLGEAAGQGAYGGGGGFVYAPTINIGTVFGVQDLFRQIDEHLREAALYSTGLRGYLS